jgi:hypothetical protein
MAKRALCVAFLLSFVLPVAPARAGGALLDFDREFYVSGDVVRARSVVWLKSALGRLEDGPYFAYLHEPAPDYPPPLPPNALRVAPVDVEPRATGETGVASVEFVLPPLGPGGYRLTLCNSPCTKTLGDVMSTELIVAASEGEGELTVAQRRLSVRLRALRVRVHNRVLGAHPPSLLGRVTALERDVRDLAARMDALAAGVRAPAPSPSGAGSAALPALHAFVVPAAALGVVFARRSRRAG